MANFQYEALNNKSGKTEKGELPAASQAEALARLQEMGLSPMKVEQAKAATKKTKQRKGKKGAKKSIGQMQLSIPGMAGKVKEKVLTIFTRQLAQLTSAGLPLLTGLKVLEKQEKDATLKRILGELSEVIEGGGTFSEGLAQHPKAFNKLFVSMVKAGELGGVLEVVLDRLAMFMEKAMKIKGKVKAAMFYPIAVLVVAVVIMGILLVFVIPKFKDVFADMLGSGLPDFTVFVLNISDTVRLNAMGTMCGVFACFFTFSMIGRTNFGRYILDKMSLFFPVIGPVVERVAIARFARTLGTLINSGVPILSALNIVKDTSGNVVVARAVQDVHDSVKEGETIVAPLDASRVFPPMVISMVDVGEKTGDMPQMLEKIADTYDEEVDRAVESLTSLIEPIMIVFLAVIVGGIVIAMFLPLIVMIEQLGGAD
ncbi:type II secretion system F family protein [bacterium]|nr:type II secretion system F family protein [bacterium]